MWSEPSGATGLETMGMRLLNHLPWWGLLRAELGLFVSVFSLQCATRPLRGGALGIILSTPLGVGGSGRDGAPELLVSQEMAPRSCLPWGRSLCGGCPCCAHGAGPGVLCDAGPSQSRPSGGPMGPVGHARPGPSQDRTAKMRSVCVAGPPSIIC